MLHTVMVNMIKLKQNLQGNATSVAVSEFESHLQLTSYISYTVLPPSLRANFRLLQRCNLALRETVFTLLPNDRKRNNFAVVFFFPKKSFSKKWKMYLKTTRVLKLKGFTITADLNLSIYFLTRYRTTHLAMPLIVSN